jgi:hypothetical protein
VKNFLICSFFIVALSAVGLSQARVQGRVLVFPVGFTEGTETARKTAVQTYEEIFSGMGYSILPTTVAERVWTQEMKQPMPTTSTPSDQLLLQLGQRMNADLVVSGTVSWHTRSIWVGLGPRTISTATVDSQIVDVNKRAVVLLVDDIEGRSDERADAWRYAAAVVVNPLITAVSGGPATPQEQRAAQLAIARSLTPFMVEQAVKPRPIPRRTGG